MIYGERIRQVRELRGWTQTELAEKLGVKQPFVAKVEGSRAYPPEQFMQNLALVSGFPLAFFNREPELDFPAGTLLFRSHSAMTMKDAAEMYRYAQVTFGVLRTMLQKRRFKDFPVRLPAGLDDARQAAELTRSELGVSPDTPIPHLINVLEKAGVLVLALPKPFEHRDAFSMWAGYDRQRPVIVFAGGASGDRLRYSMAHELGHLVMHKPVLNPVQEVETQAHRFAGEFLLPERPMCLEIIRPVSLDTFATLKPRWGVSIQALIMRAKELEIITPRKHSHLFRQLSRRGWRMREPRMFDVPVEKPRFVRQIAEMVYGIPIRYKKLAEDVGLPEDLVRAIIGSHSAKYPEAQTQQEEVRQEKKAGVVTFRRVAG